MPKIDPSRVTLSMEDHIAHVRLSRPDKMNAVDDAMIDAIIAAGEAVAASQARVCVLSGDGRAFCAGIDITGLGGLAGSDPVALIEPRTHGQGTTNRWQEMVMIWHRLPIPVIAALHGPVFGAGCQLALGADIRIAGLDLEMAVMEMKWGIVPDMGGMVLLPRLVRSDVLRKLTYTATPVGAEQALAWGLVTELAEAPVEAAMALADDLCQVSPSGLRAAKHLICFAESGAPAEEVLMAESRAQAQLVGGADQMEVIAAHFAKRTPRFKTG